MTRTLSRSHSPEVFADELPQPDALEVLLAETERQTQHDRPRAVPAAQLPGVVIGRLAEINERGEPLVRSPADDGETIRPARSILCLSRKQIGAEVVLTFENGNPQKPIILGLLAPTESPPNAKTASLEVTAADDRLELTADREIVLRCGKASITLTRAGKVLIRGAYVLSRSSGANRIKGGSVQIN